MIMVDETGRIVLLNALIESLFGYKRAELVGQRIEGRRRILPVCDPAADNDEPDAAADS